MKADDLRASILQAAIQGRLTKQDPNDEPASVLVERIREEKHRLIKVGKIKKDKNESLIFRRDGSWFETINGNDERCIDDEIPFEIPENWVWSRLQSLSIITAGQSPPGESVTNSIDSGIEFHQGKVYFTNLYLSKSHQYTSDPKKVVEPGSILLSVRAPIGPTNITERRICIGRGLCAIKPITIDTMYVLLWLRTQQKFLKSKGTGSTFIAITMDVVNQMLCPVPPIDEQNRLLSSFNKIDVLINDYEKHEEMRSSLEQNIPSKLSVSILQAAIQGKLTKQDPNDESASVLVERIREEKHRLIKVGKIKKDKNESIIFKRDGSWFETINGKDERCIDNEIPFDIPENWTWMRFGSIGIQTRGSGIKRTEILDEGYPCIRYGEIYTSYTHSFTECRSFIPESLFESVNQATFGDILLTLTGENNVDIAKSVAYLGDKTIAYGGDLLCVSKHGFNPMFLSYVLYSPYCIDQKSKLSTGNIIVHISSSKLSGILIPIPPIEEQNRIVDVIDKLLIQCNSMRLLHD